MWLSSGAFMGFQFLYLQNGRIDWTLVTRSQFLNPRIRCRLDSEMHKGQLRGAGKSNGPTM